MDKLTTKCFLFISLLGMGNCMKKDETLINLSSKYNVTIPHNIKKIYIINESNAKCNTCFVTFSEWVFKREIKNDELLLINNTMDLINRQLFLKKEQCKVIYDKKKTGVDDTGLSIIYITHQKVDSILHITPTNIAEILSRESKENL